METNKSFVGNVSRYIYGLNKDTVKLLKECDAGYKIAIDRIQTEVKMIMNYMIRSGAEKSAPLFIFVDNILPGEYILIKGERLWAKLFIMDLRKQ